MTEDGKNKNVKINGSTLDKLNKFDSNSVTSNFLHSKDTIGKSPTLLVGNQSFKEEFYKIFFGSMTNDPTERARGLSNNNSENPITNIHSPESAPFSMFDRNSSVPPTSPKLYSLQGTNQGIADGNLVGGVYSNPEDVTFINNNRGFFSSPDTQQYLDMNGVTGMSSSLSAVKMRSNELIISNYLLQKNAKLTTLDDGKTIKADSMSISKLFSQESENTQKQMFDMSVRNICNVFSPNGELRNMSIIPQDFAFIKDLNLKSNNKLVVLRRYPYPVGNNPLTSKDINKKPIATLLGYVESDSWIKIDLGEEWGEVKNPNLNQLFKGKSDNGMIDLVSIFGDAAFNTALRKANLKDGNAAYNIAADPNLVVQTHRRKEGLKNDIKITFTSVYQIKYYPGIDIENIFLDIIANIFTMTTSDRISLMTPQDSKTLEKVRGMLTAKNSSTLFSSSVSFLKTLIGNINNNINSIDTSTTDNKSSKDKKTFIESLKKKLLNDEYIQLTNMITAAQTSATEVTNEVIESLFSKYELPMKGAIAAFFGVENAPWHVTIGNPMRPTVSIGNLKMDSAELSLKGNSNLVDLPSEIHFTCTLSPAMPLGKQDLEAIFNSGIGRIYNNYLERQPKNFEREPIPNGSDTKSQTTTASGKPVPQSGNLNKSNSRNK